MSAHKAEAAALPIIIEHRSKAGCGPRFLQAIIVPSTFLFGLWLTDFLTSMFPQYKDQLINSYPHLILTAVMILLTELRVQQIRSSLGGTYTVDKNTVHWQGRKQESGNQWTEPLSDYTVHLEEHTETERTSSGSIRLKLYYYVSLRHGRNLARSVRLLRTQNREAARSAWENHAQLLGLPTSSPGTGDDTEIRQADELDMSIKERANTGLLKDKPPFDLNAAPPKHLSWSAQEERVTLNIQMVRLFLLPLTACFVGVGVWVLRFDPTVGLLCIGGGLLLIPFALFHRQTLTIDPLELRLDEYLGPWNVRTTQPIALDRIEQVNLGENKNMQPIVKIDSDDTVITLGPLHADRAEWIVGFISHVLTTAPDR